MNNLISKFTETKNPFINFTVTFVFSSIISMVCYILISIVSNPAIINGANF